MLKSCASNRFEQAKDGWARKRFGLVTSGENFSPLPALAQDNRPPDRPPGQARSK